MATAPNPAPGVGALEQYKAKLVKTNAGELEKKFRKVFPELSDVQVSSLGRQGWIEKLVEKKRTELAVFPTPAVADPMAQFLQYMMEERKAEKEREEKRLAAEERRWQEERAEKAALLKLEQDRVAAEIVAREEKEKADKLAREEKEKENKLAREEERREFLARLDLERAQREAQEQMRREELAERERETSGT